MWFADFIGRSFKFQKRTILLFFVESHYWTSLRFLVIFQHRLSHLLPCMFCQPFVFEVKIKLYLLLFLFFKARFIDKQYRIVEKFYRESSQYWFYRLKLCHRSCRCRKILLWHHFSFPKSIAALATYFIFCLEWISGAVLKVYLWFFGSIYTDYIPKYKCFLICG